MSGGQHSRAAAHAPCSHVHCPSGSQRPACSHAGPVKPSTHTHSPARHLPRWGPEQMASPCPARTRAAAGSAPTQRRGATADAANQWCTGARTQDPSSRRRSGTAHPRHMRRDPRTARPQLPRRALSSRMHARGGGGVRTCGALDAAVVADKAVVAGAAAVRQALAVPLPRALSAQRCVAAPGDLRAPSRRRGRRRRRRGGGGGSTAARRPSSRSASRSPPRAQGRCTAPWCRTGTRPAAGAGASASVSSTRQGRV